MIVEGMLKGTLTWFSPEDGYGYITPDDKGRGALFQPLRDLGWRLQDPGERREGHLQGSRGLERPAGGERLQALSEKVARLHVLWSPGCTIRSSVPNPSKG
jgi:hypothetical protein